MNTENQSNNQARYWDGIIESLLLTADKPLSVTAIKQILRNAQSAMVDSAENTGQAITPPDSAQIKACIARIQAAYQARSMALVEVSSGFRFQTREKYHFWIAQMLAEKPQKYSRATLETLALIAYKQPITRGEIEDIRGVSVSSQIMKSLLERDWIRVIGYRDVPGKPAIYATTRQFLDYFSLRHLDELPPLSQLKNMELHEEHTAPV